MYDTERLTKEKYYEMIGMNPPKESKNEIIKSN